MIFIILTVASLSQVNHPVMNNLWLPCYTKLKLQQLSKPYKIPIWIALT